MFLMERLIKIKTGAEVLAYVFEEAKKGMESQRYFVGFATSLTLPDKQYDLLYDLIGWHLERHSELATPYGYVLIN